MVEGLWRVLYVPARDRWIHDFHPSTELQESVEAWAEQCTLFGPPVDTDEPDKEYGTEIAPHGTRVSFYAIPHERLIIVRSFLP